MNKRISKFLEFEGKTLVFLAVDGQYWIALKPICEALGVNYNRQFQEVKSNPVYSQLFAQKQMVAADGKMRKMVCLPEKRIYGWLMQIQSNVPGLNEYQIKCHDILFDHFHGTITGRKELLSQKAKAQTEMDEVMNSLDPEMALKFERAKKRRDQITAQLRDMDRETIEEEKDLFTHDNNEIITNK
jgi:hypothetical protein